MILKEVLTYSDDMPVNIMLSSIEEYPIHYHDTDLEIIVIVEGTAKLIIGYRTILLKEGDVFIINEGELHSIYSSKANRILTLQFDLNFFVQYDKDLEYSYMLCETYFEGKKIDDLNIKLRSKINELTAIYISKKGMGISKKLISLSIDLLKYMKNNFEYLSIYKTNEHFINKLELQENPAGISRMRDIYKFIYNNYNRKITLQELADEMHFNMYYLSHIIKDFMGISFQELLNFSRIEISERFLLETDMKISEIALECGFSATRYYVKSFEKWYDQSPEEYRDYRTGHTNVSIKRKKIPLQDVLNYIKKDRREYKENKELSFRDFFSKVIHLNSKVMKVKRVSDVRNVLFVNNAIDMEMLIRDDTFKFLKNKFDIVKVISLKNKTYSNELIKIIDELEKNRLDGLMYEFEDSGDTKNHMDFLKSIMKFISLHSIEMKKPVIYIVNRSNSINEFYDFADSFISEKEDVGLFEIKVIERTESGFYGGRYMFDSICGTPMILERLVNDKSIKFYKMIDEGTSLTKIMSGDCGLITWNGLKKSSYFVFLIYSMLGREVITESKDYIITKEGEDYQILFYASYNKHEKKMFEMNSIEDVLEIMKRYIPGNEYIVELENLKGRYKVVRVRITEDCCIFNRIAEIEQKSIILRDEEVLLDRSLFPEVIFETVDIKKRKDIPVYIPGFGSELILLKKY